MRVGCGEAKRAVHVARGARSHATACATCRVATRRRGAARATRWPPARPAPARRRSSTCAARCFAGTEPGPGHAEDDLEQRQQRHLGRGQDARRRDREQARDRELDDAEQREQAEVVRRRARTAAQRQGQRAPTAARRSAPPASRSTSPPRLLCWIAVQLMRRGDRHGERDDVPSRWRGSTAPSSCAYIQAMPTPATTIAAQVRAAGAGRARRARPAR